MAVHKYKKIDDMPPTRRKPGDPENLRIVAYLLGLGRRLAMASGTPSKPAGIHRFRTLEEAQAAEDAAGAGKRTAD